MAPHLVINKGSVSLGLLPRGSVDDAQCWRWSVASGYRYFKLLNRQDDIFEGDHWALYDRYKSGPSWWRFTGEPGADVIDATDLPPSAPR